MPLRFMLEGRDSTVALPTGGAPAANDRRTGLGPRAEAIIQLGPDLSTPVQPLANPTALMPVYEVGAAQGFGVYVFEFDVLTYGECVSQIDMDPGGAVLAAPWDRYKTVFLTRDGAFLQSLGGMLVALPGAPAGGYRWGAAALSLAPDSLAADVVAGPVNYPVNTAGWALKGLTLTAGALVPVAVVQDSANGAFVRVRSTDAANPLPQRPRAYVRDDPFQMVLHMRSGACYGEYGAIIDYTPTALGDGSVDVSLNPPFDVAVRAGDLGDIR